MVATDQEDPQKKQAMGLLQLLIEDEEKRRAFSEAANNVGAAAAMIQQFNAPQLSPVGMGGGLLAQPTHPVMSAPGTGMMGMQPTGDAEKLKKMAEFLGFTK